MPASFMLQHLALVDSLVPALDAKAAVAFGLRCIARLRRSAASVAPDEEARQIHQRTKEIEEAWWCWCEGGVETPSQHSDAIRSAIKLVVPSTPCEVVRFDHLTACEGFFSALEEGSDFWYAKYTSDDPFQAIQALEDIVPPSTIEALLRSEVQRQEADLMILADGYGPDTRARLTQAGAEEALFQAAALSPKP